MDAGFGGRAPTLRCSLFAETRERGAFLVGEPKRHGSRSRRCHRGPMPVVSHPAGGPFGGAVFGGAVFGGAVFGGAVFGGAVFGGAVFGGAATVCGLQQCGRPRRQAISLLGPFCSALICGEARAWPRPVPGSIGIGPRARCTAAGCRAVCAAVWMPGVRFVWRGLAGSSGSGPRVRCFWRGRLWGGFARLRGRPGVRSSGAACPARPARPRAPGVGAARWAASLPAADLAAPSTAGRPGCPPQPTQPDKAARPAVGCPAPARPAAARTPGAWSAPDWAIAGSPD
jgi:hypothetical protein